MWYIEIPYENAVVISLRLPSPISSASTLSSDNVTYRRIARQLNPNLGRTSGTISCRISWNAEGGQHSPSIGLIRPRAPDPPARARRILAAASSRISRWARSRSTCLALYQWHPEITSWSWRVGGIHRFVARPIRPKMGSLDRSVLWPITTLLARRVSTDAP